jgi:hypothetical protein
MIVMTWLGCCPCGCCPCWNDWKAASRWSAWLGGATWNGCGGGVPGGWTVCTSCTPGGLPPPCTSGGTGSPRLLYQCAQSKSSSRIVPDMRGPIGGMV